MINKNKLFGIILGISHFFTDAIASFVLVSISIYFFKENSNFIFSLFFYFMLYNFIAFGGQSIIGYFLDKFKEKSKSFFISKIIILISFIFYLIGLFLLIYSNNFDETIYIISVVFVGLGSAFFHIGGGNISLLSEKNKASVLGLFASGGVIGLSFGYFLATFYPHYYFIFLIILAILGLSIFFWKDYKLETEIEKKNNIKEYFKINVNIFVFIIMAILAIRSAFWTNYQYVFFNDKLIIFYLAIAAFLGKLTGGFLEDSNFFKEKYFIITGIVSSILILINTFIWKNIFLVLIGIFGLTLFISPITIILNKIFTQKKAIIISYSFGLSLILGYFIYVLF